MYSVCNDLDLAQKIFGLIMDKTQVSWFVMIQGYALRGHTLEALSLFLKMKLSGTRVDFIMFINILPAFAKIDSKIILSCVIF